MSAKVYFVESDTQLIKIGTSINVTARMSALQCHHPRPLRLLCTIDGSYKLENEIHDHFSRLRKMGEWFEHDDELERFISDVSTGLYKATDYIHAVREANSVMTEVDAEDCIDETGELFDEVIEMFGGKEKLAASAGIKTHRLNKPERLPTWLLVHVIRRDKKVARHVVQHLCDIANRHDALAIDALKRTTEQRRAIELKYQIPQYHIDMALICRHMWFSTIEIVESVDGPDGDGDETTDSNRIESE